MAKKLTYEEVREIFESRGNKLISTDYVNADTPLDYICDCDRLDKKRISDFKKGARCKECKKKKIRKKRCLTFEEVKKIFENQGNKLISTEYINSKTPLKYICDCGEEDKKALNNFKNGQRCKKCADIKTGDGLRTKIEEVKRLFEEKNCILTSDYVNAQVPVAFICNCGERGKTRVGDFRKGARCAKCNAEKRVETRIANGNYAEKYQELFEKEGYEMLEPYIEAKNNVSLKCPRGHNISMKPANFKTGNRCGECSPKRKKTFEEVGLIFENEGYAMRSTEYVEAFHKLEVTCSKGHEVEISWDNFRSGKRCARCNESKGEKKVFDYLTKYQVLFDTQHTFDDCKHKRKLPFDFVIFNEKNEIIQLIEYDGEFHFIATEFTNGEEGLKQTQKRDQIKTDYCKKKGIPLLRIHYTEFERIEEILDREVIDIAKVYS